MSDEEKQPAGAPSDLDGAWESIVSKVSGDLLGGASEEEPSPAGPEPDLIQLIDEYQKLTAEIANHPEKTDLLGQLQEIEEELRRKVAELSEKDFNNLLVEVVDDMGKSAVLSEMRKVKETEEVEPTVEDKRGPEEEGETVTTETKEETKEEADKIEPLESGDDAKSGSPLSPSGASPERKAESGGTQEEKKGVIKEIQELIPQIKEDELGKIGFNDLTEAQQAWVWENFKHLFYQQIEEGKISHYEARQAAEKWYKTIPREWLKPVFLALYQKKAKEELRKDTAAQLAVMKRLIDDVKEIGMEVRRDEEGNLYVEYAVGLNLEGGEFSEEEQRLVKEFNQVATRFAETPAEWNFKTASFFKRRAYRKLERRFNKLLTKITQL